MVTDVPPEAVEFVRNDDVQVVSFARRYQYVVAFNSRRSPLRLASRASRTEHGRRSRALIQESFRGTDRHPPARCGREYWAYDSSIAPYTLRSRAGQSLLDAAGLDGAMPAIDGAASAFRFTCLIPENFSVLERMALEVQKQLYQRRRRHAVRGRPARASSTPDARRAIRGDPDRHDQRPDSWPALHLLAIGAATFRGAYNVFGYENPEAERLFDVLRTTTNEAASGPPPRLQRVLLDDPPALFLAWNERAAPSAETSRSSQDPRRDPRPSTHVALDARSAADAGARAVKKISTRFAVLMAAAAVCRCSPTAPSRSCRCAPARSETVVTATSTSRGSVGEQIQLYVIGSVRSSRPSRPTCSRRGSRRGSRIESSRTTSSSFPSSRSSRCSTRTARDDRHEPARQADRRRFPAPTASTSTAR